MSIIICDLTLYVILGGAGYIGGHLTDHLIKKGSEVVVIDDFSLGNYINRDAKIIKYDLRIPITNEFNEIEKGSIFYHLAAHPDVKSSMTNILEHFERDVKVTLNVMELARKKDAVKVIFTSSSTVYGESNIIPTPETAELRPISNYGLFKLLCENIVNYYATQYGIKSTITRLANIIGGRVTHGVIIDFVNKLKSNPNVLKILGNGKQRKSYLYINDLIEAFFILETRDNNTFNVYNVGNEDWITVDEIADIVISEMGVNPKIIYEDSGEGRGWPGDVRFMLLDITKIKKLGWKPKLTSKDAVRKTVKDILNKN